jgi:hypothetical protein
MYPSGQWDGFWEQEQYGRQSMTAFRLEFTGGEVVGGGQDVVGRFTVRGECDPGTGRVRLLKHYFGKHDVTYDGVPDGEGCIAGTWNIWGVHTGPFLLRPIVPRPTGDEPIHEIR